MVFIPPGKHIFPGYGRKARPGIQQNVPADGLGILGGETVK